MPPTPITARCSQRMPATKRMAPVMAIKIREVPKSGCKKTTSMGTATWSKGTINPDHRSSERPSLAMVAERVMIIAILANSDGWRLKSLPMAIQRWAPPAEVPLKITRISKARLKK